MTTPPGTMGVSGQLKVAVMAGAVVTGQVELALLVTTTPQRLVAFAVKVLVVEQVSVVV